MENKSLQQAANTGDYDGVTTLLKQGATLTEVKDVLRMGCATGDARVVLDNRKRELQQINQEKYLLNVASGNGYSEVVKILLEYGAQVNLQEEDGGCALMYASHCGHAEVVKIILENGAQVDLQEENGGCALMIARHNGHAEVV